MRVFGTYRQLRQANNRIVGWFFAAMLVLTLAFVAALAARLTFGL